MFPVSAGQPFGDPPRAFATRSHPRFPWSTAQYPLSSDLARRQGLRVGWVASEMFEGDSYVLSPAYRLNGISTRLSLVVIPTRRSTGAGPPGTVAWYIPGSEPD